MDPVSPSLVRSCCRAAFCSLFLCAGHGVCQQAPGSPNRPWHSWEEREFRSEAITLSATFPIDPARTYSLAELIDLAEMQNPETREAWQRARAQAASLGIARSELYPTLAATALSEVQRSSVFFGTNFFAQTVEDFGGGLDLSYTVFDFGARSDRISAAKAQVLAANFAFNDTQRQVIYEVEQAYYQLLNASGQMDAAEASLTNALTVQGAAEDRLNHGLTTMPDVLLARSAAASAEYDLQSVRGTVDIARGNLARALSISPTSPIRTQPLAELVIPSSIADSVDQALDRAFAQRPDLMQQLADVRSANARVKEARAAYYPILSLSASGTRSYARASQQSLPWVSGPDWEGGAGLSLNWPLFEGGARKNRLAQAKADALASEARVKATRDAVAEQVWRAYTNLRTAFRERDAALALLTATEQSYAAVLEAYSHGLRNLLDVTAAQRTLAQARSTDVLARTTVLSALAELSFQTANSINRTAGGTKP